MEEKVKYVKVESKHEKSDLVMIMVTPEDKADSAPYIYSVGVFHVKPTDTKLHAAIDAFVNELNK